MNVSTRPANTEDVAHIIADLSDVTAAEFRRVDIDSGMLQTLAERAVLHGEAYTFFDEEGPLCILGLRPSDGVLTTWFIATARFFGMKAGTVFHFRGLLKYIADQYPGETIESKSYSRHPEARRWFRLMGFRLIDDSQDYLLFRLYN